MELARDDVYDSILQNDLDSVRFILDKVKTPSHDNQKFFDDVLVFAIGNNKIDSVKILIKEYNANADVNRQAIKFLMGTSKVGYFVREYLLHGDDSDCDC